MILEMNSSYQRVHPLILPHLPALAILRTIKLRPLTDKRERFVSSSLKKFGGSDSDGICQLLLVFVKFHFICYLVSWAGMCRLPASSTYHRLAFQRLDSIIFFLPLKNLIRLAMCPIERIIIRNPNLPCTPPIDE